jgi:hypothetical protein
MSYCICYFQRSLGEKKNILEKVYCTYMFEVSRKSLLTNSNTFFGLFSRVTQKFLHSPQPSNTVVFNHGDKTMNQ